MNKYILRTIVLLAVLALSCTAYSQYSVITDIIESDGESKTVEEWIKNLDSRLDRLEGAPRTESQVTSTKAQVTSSYPSSPSPMYNLNGSWTAVRDPIKLRAHLAGKDSEHRFSRPWLDRLTMQQLWYLHDSTHQGTTPQGTTSQVTSAPTVVRVQTQPTLTPMFRRWSFRNNCPNCR